MSNHNNEGREDEVLKHELDEVRREERELLCKEEELKHREEELKRELEEREREERELHIFVNRRKFERGDGVKREMNGGEIATLVGVPIENAVVRYDLPHDKKEIAPTEVIQIKNGEHFLVTRKIVEGGCVA